MKIRNKAQSTLEYTVLVTGVVVVILAYVAGTGEGGFQKTLNTTLNSATSKMSTTIDGWTPPSIPQ